MEELAGNLKVDPGETVGILAAQSVAEPLTQTLLRLFHNGGEYSALAGEELPRLTAILMASKESPCTQEIFEVCRTEGIEAARNAIASELTGTFRKLDVSVNTRHLRLIADAMAWSGKVRGMDALIANKSVLGRAAHHAANRHLVEAAMCGEKEHLKGNTENILIGRQIPVGTGSVRLSIDKEAQSTRDALSAPPEVEYEYREHGEPAYATISMKVGRNLGARNPVRHSAYRDLIRRKRYLNRPVPKSERNFYNAHPELRLVCGRLNVPEEMRESVAVLYRKCINSRITNGRNTYAMAIAVVAMVCREWEVERDLEFLAKETGTKMRKVELCIGAISRGLSYGKATLPKPLP